MTTFLHPNRWPAWVRRLVMFLAVAVILVSPTSLAVGYSILAGRVSETAKTSYIESCAGNNEVRTEVVKLTDNLLSRSTKSAAATAAAPTATPRQKLVAQQNLAGAKAITDQIHQALQPRPCMYPPPVTSTISSTVALKK